MFTGVLVLHCLQLHSWLLLICQINYYVVTIGYVTPIQRIDPYILKPYIISVLFVTMEGVYVKGTVVFVKGKMPA